MVTQNSTIYIRIPLGIKNKFYKLANDNKDIPSKLIRNFIKKYIKEMEEKIE